MGKFITFEGGEGVGKSTQSKMLYDYLASVGIDAILTREVGGIAFAEEIRNILLKNEGILPTTELMLVTAARCEHLAQVIIPALNRGTWVICDRFVDSTACYQGMQDGIGVDYVFELHKKICNNIMPDATILLDLPPAEALKRVQTRSDNNRFDRYNLDFHNRIYSNFISLCNKFPTRINKLDVLSMSLIEIHHKILSITIDGK